MLGTYKGKYKYDKHPNLERINDGIIFTLIITEYDGMIFRGIVNDDIKSGGTRGEGMIEGVVKDGRIEFVKQMPVMTLMTKKGKRVEVPKKHKPVYYTGVLNGETFEGGWKIKSGITLNRYFIAIGTGTTGTWKMTKE